MSAGLGGVRVCIVRHGSIANDKRTQQVAASLVRAGAEVLVVAECSPVAHYRSGEGYEVVQVDAVPASAHSIRPARVLSNTLRNLARPLIKALSIVRQIRRFRPDVVHCMNVDKLLVGALAAGRGAFIYDSREHFATTAVADRFTRWWWMTKERVLVPRAAGVFTVSELIAADLARRYRIPEPVVVYNGCIDRVTEAVPAHAPVRLLHLGKAYADRNLEEAIGLMAELRGKATLTLQGGGNVESELKLLVDRMGLSDVVSFRSPVPPGQIVDSIAEYDVGLHNIRPETRSYQWTTANKLFEYLAAGLAVVVPDELPATDRIVAEGGFGIIFTPGRIDDALRTLVDDPELVSRLKARAVKASSGYTWAEQEAKLLGVYESALALRPTRR